MKSEELRVKSEESYVFLRNVRFHAFHGVLPQERQVGGDFLLTLRVGYPFKREMDIPSQLLEHVAGRIVKAITTAFPEVTSIDLELTKQNPPIGADSDGAGILLKVRR